MSESDPVPEPIAPEPVPETVSISDLMNDHDMICQRESIETAFLTAQLLSVNPLSLRPTLLQWASMGYPVIFPILSLKLDVPEICADGVSRSTQKFVEYCLGMPLSEVVASLSAKLPGMEVSYSCSYRTLCIHVSKSA